MKLPIYIKLELEKSNLTLEQKGLLLILYHLYFIGIIPNKDNTIDINREFFCYITKLSWTKLKNKLLDLKQMNMIDFIILNNGKYDIYKIFFDRNRYIRNSVKEKLFKINKHKCEKCGLTNIEHKNKFKHNLEIHHKIPFIKNGSNELENLQLLCKDCHLNERNNQTN